VFCSDFLSPKGLFLYLKTDKKYSAGSGSDKSSTFSLKVQSVSRGGSHENFFNAQKSQFVALPFAMLNIFPSVFLIGISLRASQWTESDRFLIYPKDADNSVRYD
jgi:hypothetical protein